ncbi:MAG: S1 RNA-binding domain-containing protein [Thermoanaerobaculia bacterium]|nr:S1 RNA-binding domain-containing protein [Thermoanaerobaculia bacterium]
MSEEKNSSTEESTRESPETHPEVTGEVRSDETPAEGAVSESERESAEGSGEEGPDTGPDRPEASGEVEVEHSSEDEAAGDEGGKGREEAGKVEPGLEKVEKDETEEKNAEESGDTADEAKDEEPPADSEPASEPEAEVETEGGVSESVSEEEEEPEPSVETVEEIAEETPDRVANAEGEEPEAREEPAPEDEESDEGQGKKGERKKKRRKKRRKAEKGKKGKNRAEGEEASKDEPPEIAALRRAKKERTPVTGRVFGWNKGGFHVVLDETPAFCPRSEMAADGRVAEPDSYIDQEMEFLVLRVQDKGRRIVVSRAAFEKKHEYEERQATLSEISPGSTVKGTVTSIVDFGAFVDLGGVEGLVHRSELTRRRYEEITDVVEEGQEVEVKVLKIQKGGRRISLSMKALEPDPWKGVEEKYPEGSVVEAKVEHTAEPGAFIELEPGLTGLLPTSKMNIPREAIPARVFPPGREVKVVVMSVDPRRRRISLALEGSKVGATNKDLTEFKKQQKQQSGFGSMAAAFADLDVDLEDREENS